jgi:hypothetical protein
MKEHARRAGTLRLQDANGELIEDVGETNVTWRSRAFLEQLAG